MRYGRSSRPGRPSRAGGVIAGGGGGGAASLASAIEALTPVGWWKLDEASGTLASSGSDATGGTVTGTLTYADVAGPDGNNYATFQSGTYVSIASNAALNLTTSKTMCIAFRPTSGAGLNALFAKGTSSGDREWLVYDATGTGGIQATLFQNSGTSAHRRSDLNPLVPISNNDWHFAICVYDKSGDVRVYLDQLAERPGTKTGPTGTVEAGSTQAITLGGWPVLQTTYYMAGAMAHAALFEGAMSDADCQTLMGAAIAEGWTP